MKHAEAVGWTRRPDTVQLLVGVARPNLCLLATSLSTQSASLPSCLARVDLRARKTLTNDETHFVRSGSLMCRSVWHARPQLDLLTHVVVKQSHCCAGDLLTCLNVWHAWEEHGRSPKWAHRNSLNQQALLRAARIRDELLLRLRQLQVPVASCGGDMAKVQQVLWSILLELVLELVDMYVGCIVSIENVASRRPACIRYACTVADREDRSTMQYRALAAMPTALLATDDGADAGTGGGPLHERGTVQNHSVRPPQGQ